MLHHITLLSIRIRRPRTTPLQTTLFNPPSRLLFQPNPLLLLQACLSGILLLRQLLPLYEDRDRDPQRRKRRVEDPHDPQTVRVGDIYGVFLPLGKRAEQFRRAAEGAAGEAVGELGAEGVFEEGAFLAEFVLEDHAAEDDGDGGCELADEAEGCGGEGDVVAFDV